MRQMLLLMGLFVTGCQSTVQQVSWGQPRTVITPTRTLMSQVDPNLSHLTLPERQQLLQQVLFPATNSVSRALLRSWPVTERDDFYRLAKAKQAWLVGQNRRARYWLRRCHALPASITGQVKQALAVATAPHFRQAWQLIAHSSLANEPSVLAHTLKQASTQSLSKARGLTGWLAWERLHRLSITHPERWAAGYQQWRQTYPALATLYAKQKHSVFPTHVVVYLPPEAAHGHDLQQGMMAAYYPLRQHIPFQITFFDSQQVRLSDLSLQGFDYFINAVTHPDPTQLAKIAKIMPVLSLTKQATIPGVVQLDTTWQAAAQAAATRMVQVGLSRVIVLGDESATSRQLSNAFVAQWRNLQGGTLQLKSLPNHHVARWVKQLLHVDQSEKRVAKIKHWLRHPIRTKTRARQDVDAVFLALSEQKARQLVPLLRFHYFAEPIYGGPWLHTQASRAANHDLSGVVFVDEPWRLKSPHRRPAWPKPSALHGTYYAQGLDALNLVFQQPRLIDQPQQNYPGACGQWYYARGVFYRQWPFAQFHRGHIRRLSNISWFRQHPLFVRL